MAKPTFYDLFAKRGLIVTRCYWKGDAIKSYFIVECISSGGSHYFEFNSAKQAAVLLATDNPTFMDYCAYENA
jgi:hypothetical protein